MEALALVGIVLVAALGGYLVTVGSGVGSNEHGTARPRRRKGPAIVYLVTGTLTASVGLLFAFAGLGETEPDDQVMDASFAGGLVATIDEAVYLAIGGCLALAGAMIVIGAWCGRRGWPLARLVLALGLIVAGVPLLLVGIGVVHLLLAPTLLFWRPEDARVASSR